MLGASLGFGSQGVVKLVYACGYDEDAGITIKVYSVTLLGIVFVKAGNTPKLWRDTSHHVESSAQ